MFDAFTLIIYVTLLISSVALLSNVKNKNEYALSLERLNSNHYFFLLLISFVVGFRFEVGTDWLGYKLDYENFHLRSETKFSEQYYEYGFYIFSKATAYFGLGVEWLFLSIGFLSWFLIMKSAPSYILPLVMFFLFADEFFFWSMNGVRQSVAIGFWLISIKFIIDRQLVYFLICIFLGSLFHESILILLPLYFVPFQVLYNYKFILVIFLFSLVIGSFKDLFLSQFIDLLEKYSSQAEVLNRYKRYADTNRIETEETTLGIGFYLKIIINFFILLLSGRILKLRSDLKPYFFLFFLGAVIFNIFYDLQVIGRINSYFLVLRAYVLGIIVYYYWKHFNIKIIPISIIALYILLFFGSIYRGSNNCAPYNFIF